MVRRGLCQIGIHHLIGRITKKLRQEATVNMRCGETCLIEGQTILLNLLFREGKSRIEMATQTLYIFTRHLPNTEEAQDMIDAETVKIVSQLRETILPPLEMILLHRLPIIGREQPVLSIGREIIRWRTCLSVHVEIVRLCPCLNAGTAHANRKITFQHDTIATGIIRDHLELIVQHILQEIVEGDLRPCVALLSTERTTTDAIIDRITTPLAKIRCPIALSQVAISGIRHQPILVARNKLFKIRASHPLGSLLLKELSTIV